MTTLYNEWDAKTAAWLRELCKQGHVTNGVVDERSITELRGEDLRGYGRVHLFAGIAGWDYALRLAGFPDDRVVWTGSCPCQPFSAAGKRKGQADERHLWPEMFRLVRECRPDTIFGEQVASAVGHGWIDGVFADLEGIGYTCGAVVLGAHSVGAPHMRQRLWWVADAAIKRVEKLVCVQARPTYQAGESRQAVALDARMGNSEWMDLREGMGEPGLFASSDGISEGMVRLRGYGNAIVPQVAAAFVRAFMESEAS
jgi:DNA (cytosine-5)-methyltransferase 1